MRSIFELDDLPVSEWTQEEAYAHLRYVFYAAVKGFPDLMEPYVSRLGDDRAEEIAIMRAGLRETLAQRFPKELV